MRVAARQGGEHVTGRPLPRTCPGCGWRFRPEVVGQVYCGQICAGRAAMAEVYAALTRFASGGGSGAA
jgi:hypothetical protein